MRFAHIRKGFHIIVMLIAYFEKAMQQSKQHSLVPLNAVYLYLSILCLPFLQIEIEFVR